jgi:hypothetical protein
MWGPARMGETNFFSLNTWPDLYTEMHETEKVLTTSFPSKILPENLRG